MELSRRTLRQIEHLSDTCTFDMEKRAALVPLHYETPEDLLDMHMSRPGVPVVSDETIDYLCDQISDIPKEFNVDFTLTIDDYGEYDHASLLHSLRTTIENTFYYHDENQKKTNALAVLFLVIGVLVLALETVGGHAGWYGSIGSVTKDMIETVMEVMVWVFVWEGAALLFLTYENESVIFSRNMRRFHGLRFLNEKGETLSGLDREQLYEDWIYLSREEAFARNYILFSNAALMALFSVTAVEFFAALGNATTTECVFFALSAVLITLLVCSNLSFYRESGRLRHYALLISVLVLALSIFGVIYSLVNGQAYSQYVVWYGILAADLLINIVCLRFMQKQSVEVKKTEKERG